MSSAAPSIQSADANFSPEHADALGELLNIAFGSAAAPLAALIGRFVVMQVPKLRQVHREQTLGWLRQEIDEHEKIHVVRQAFGPKFQGECVLVLRGFEEDSMTRLINGGVGPGDERGERAAVLELANIIVGACVGRFSELVGVYTTYAAPELESFADELDDVELPINPSLTEAIIVHTGFTVEGESFAGFVLFLLPGHVVQWLTQVLDDMV